MRSSVRDPVGSTGSSGARRAHSCGRSRLQSIAASRRFRSRLGLGIEAHGLGDLGRDVRNAIAQLPPLLGGLYEHAEPLYTASAVATGDGRNGRVRSLDGLVDTDVRVPVEMGGSGGAPNPEVLA